MAEIYIHPTALVESETIGDGTRIWAYTHVMRGASIGANCNVGEHCYIESGAVVGSNVTIKNGNELWEGVSLADGVFVGPKVSFTNDLRPRSPRLPQAARRYTTHSWLSLIFVEKGASIGAGAIILAGNRIGEYAMVGAGAVVTHSLPAHALVIGSPARIAGWVCECGCRLKFHDAKSVCEECGLVFLKDENSVRAVPHSFVAA